MSSPELNMLILIYNQLVIMFEAQIVKEGHDAGMVSDETYIGHLKEMSRKMLDLKPIKIEEVKI